MELWKFVILTYLSVVVIEGIPSINFLTEDEYESSSDLSSGAELRHETHRPSLFERWKNRKKTTHHPEHSVTVPSTTIAPGSLADLNIRLQSLQDQITNLNNGILLEEQQISAMSAQIASMSSVLTAVFNAVVSGSG